MPNSKGTLASATLILLTLGGCSHRTREPETSPSPVPVVIRTVRARKVARERLVPGTIGRAHQAVLSTELGGQVTRVAVHTGSVVRRGALLLEVGVEAAQAHLTEAEARVAEMQAAAALAAHDETRYATLLKQGAVTPLAFERIQRTWIGREAALHAAEEALAAARAAFGHAVLDAPFPGRVIWKGTRLGDDVPPGARLVAIAGGPAEVRIHVGIRLYRRLTRSTRVRVWSGGRFYPARILARARSADPATHKYLVKVLLTGRPAYGAYARVLFTIGQRVRLVIPSQAIVHRGGLTGVFVVGRHRHVYFHLVRLASSGRIPGRRIVDAGLRAGEQVATRPAHPLANGMTVAGRPPHG